MLLQWLGESRGEVALTQAATSIEAALEQALANPSLRTSDLGGRANTESFGQTVAAALRQGA